MSPKSKQYDTQKVVFMIEKRAFVLQFSEELDLRFNKLIIDFQNLDYLID